VNNIAALTAIFTEKRAHTRSTRCVRACVWLLLMHHLSICGRDSCICYCLHCRHWCGPIEVSARGSHAPVRQLIRPRCRPAAANVILSSS